MPSFAGLVDEGELQSLVAYLQSLRGGGRDERTAVERAEPARPRSPQRASYLTASTGIASWLLTTDHKRIALLYMVAITVFFFIGGAGAVAMRIELFTPQGDLCRADAYNRAFTLHGVVMVWFFLVPSIPTTLGNFLLPLMIGARDLAFPRLNLISWYIFIAAGRAGGAGPCCSGGVDTGWTFYTPLSTAFSNGNVLAGGAAPSSSPASPPSRPR